MAGCAAVYKTVYRQRHKVENMLARLKDWRRISMRSAARPHLLEWHLNGGNQSLLFGSVNES